jgi:hypothetical protein
MATKTVSLGEILSDYYLFWTITSQYGNTCSAILYDDSKVSLSETNKTEAIKLLAAFENACTELAESNKTIPLELEKMRSAGKDKTVRYKEMFAQKLYNLQIAALFERHGIDWRAYGDTNN